MQKEIIAVIDVGSHALRMKIGELAANGAFREIENFRRSTALGHDTFTNSKVSFESVDKVCGVLKNFKNTMDDYGVVTYKALATSAIREAANRAYIIDQIKLKTQLNIDVIDNSEEQFLTHKALKFKLENYNQIIAEGAVIVVIGAGSIQITMYKNGQLLSSQNVKMGALRIKEVLGTLESEVLNYQKILDEYITVNLEGLEFFEEKHLFKHFIAVGGEINTIKKIAGLEEEEMECIESIPRDKFNRLYEEVIKKSTEEIAQDYGIRRERSDILGPSMMLFKKFLDNTGAGTIVIPNISLNDGIIRSIYESLYKGNKKDKTLEEIAANARVISKKFNYNNLHCENVEKNALVLFDKLKKLHGLENERILLKVAAILHDIGKFIALDMHYVHSYNMIRSLDIFGLSKEQMELIANISRYHSMEIPKDKDPNFMQLSEKDRVLVAKLVAILRISDALDRSHKQKIDIQLIKLKDKELVIRATSKEPAVLEEWTFRNKAIFFQEVFGITPVLKIKREIE